MKGQSLVWVLLAATLLLANSGAPHFLLTDSCSSHLAVATCRLCFLANFSTATTDGVAVLQHLTGLASLTGLTGPTGTTATPHPRHLRQVCSTVAQTCFAALAVHQTTRHGHIMHSHSA